MVLSALEKKLQVCKSTRDIAANSLYIALGDLLENKTVSEADLRNRWLDEMNKDFSIFSEGWYSPPPYGIAVLFGTDLDKMTCRLNCENFRPKETWPHDDIVLNRENGIIYVYASPVHKRTGIIGDFGMTIYF